jgi:hypothetical protein
MITQHWQYVINIDVLYKYTEDLLMVTHTQKFK